MTLQGKIATGFALAVVVLILLGGYSYRNNQENIATNKMLVHTNEVLYNVEQMLVSALDIEVGQRGFELTGKEDFLEPYTASINNLNNRLSELRNLIKDNEDQRRKIDTLHTLIGLRLQFSKARIVAKRKAILRDEALKQISVKSKKSIQEDSSKAELIIGRMDGKVVMDNIRAVIKRMQNEEKRLLEIRLESSEKQISESNITFVVFTIFIVVLLLIVFIIIQVNLKARSKAEQKAKTFQDLLQASIESQSDVQVLSIDKEYHYQLFNSSHKESTLRAYGVVIAVGMSMLDSITDPKDKLKVKDNFDKAIAGQKHSTIEEYGDVEHSYFETRYNPIIADNGEITGATAFSINITERKLAEDHLLKITNDLEVSNKELEAFCYSISHDLRAPLRSINGYSRVLLEDYADKFDQDGRTVLDTVMKNAKRMGKLIDDLLNFSRVGKTWMSKGKLTMDTIVRETIDEQLMGVPNNISLNIHPLPNSVGDPSMIRQVWTNLISNAIKYSSKNKHPKIEIGSTTQDKIVTYYVKDNGVGFDMTYAHKLFGVFQRLHKSSDFEGTGVGLAIISRIILKHKGKVWADSKPNEGAIFYFSLPN